MTTADSSGPHIFQILFDPDQVDQHRLDTEVRRLLNQHLNEVRIEVGQTEMGYPLLSITGALKAVDECHAEVVEVFVGRFNWRHFRLKDTAGDTIRQQAYPILAEIEQELRAFINQCLIETYGFAWWTSLGQVSIPGLDKDRPAYNPLEFTTFDELVHIVTIEVAEWEEGRSMSASDLMGLLDIATNLEEFKANLQRKTRKFSFWNDVFARYLVDKRQWDDLKRDLEHIIRVRNKVMHHNSIRLGEIRTLETKRENLIRMITTRVKLSDQDRTDIQQRTKGIRDVYARIVRETITPNTHDRLIQQVYSATTSEDLLAILTTLEQIAENELPRAENYRLRATVFAQLRELVQQDSLAAEPLILERLLPLCFQNDPEISMGLSELRECLANWVEQYPETEASRIRSLVLERVVMALDSPNPVGGCRTVSHIGYRETNVVEALWRIVVQRDDEVGDGALSALSSLGLSGEEHARASAEANRRATLRANNSLFATLSRLANVNSVFVILEYWLDPNRTSSIDKPLAYTIVRQILDRQSDDVSLHDDIWRRVVPLVEQSTSERSFWDFDIGHIHEICNSPDVVPTLWRWMEDIAERTDNPAWTRHLICSRLEKFTRPRQLEGWSRLGEGQTVDLLRRDACLDTGNDGRAPTRESMVKTTAWLTLLRGARAEVLTWFEAAVASETSRFEQSRVMNWLACFRVDPLPQLVIDWITEEYDGSIDGPDGRESARRFAAIQMARGAATLQAFDALLRFGYTHEGQVYVPLTDALTEVALWLVRHGDTSVIDRLFDDGLASSLAHRRLAAAQAVERIAAFDPSLLMPYTEQLVAALYDNSRQLIERGLCIQTLGHLVDWPLPESLVVDLENWAREPDRWVGYGSLLALTEHGQLEHNTRLLQDVVGLIQVENSGWVVNVATVVPDWMSDVVGQLYSRDLVTFAPAVAGLLQKHEWRIIVQTLQWLYITHPAHDASPLPQLIEDALVNQVREKFSMVYTEPSLFTALSDLAPRRLTSEIWEGLSADWSPNAREALAVALGSITVASDPQLGDAVLRLQPLMLDPVYAVRRAAFRSLGRLAPTTLVSFCRTWLATQNVNLALTASEATGWLEPDRMEVDQAVVDMFFNTLITHPDPRVRESTLQTVEQRRNREWAKAYLAKVLAVIGETNQDVLDAWRYGNALAQLGDDECLEALRKHLGVTTLPPNVRYWLSLVGTEMEKIWRKITQDWPQPWRNFEGAVEHGVGKLITGSAGGLEISYSVWQHPSKSPRGVLSWGGVLSCADSFALLTQDGGVIELQDGRQGQVLFSHVKGASADFLGNGAYPQKMVAERADQPAS